MPRNPIPSARELKVAIWARVYAAPYMRVREDMPEKSNISHHRPGLLERALQTPRTRTKLGHAAIHVPPGRASQSWTATPTNGAPTLDAADGVASVGGAHHRPLPPHSPPETTPAAPKSAPRPSARPGGVMRTPRTKRAARDGARGGCIPGSPRIDTVGCKSRISLSKRHLRPLE